MGLWFVQLGLRTEGGGKGRGDGEWNCGGGGRVEFYST